MSDVLTIIDLPIFSELYKKDLREKKVSALEPDISQVIKENDHYISNIYKDFVLRSIRENSDYELHEASVRKYEFMKSRLDNIKNMYRYIANFSDFYIEDWSIYSGSKYFLDSVLGSIYITSNDVYYALSNNINKLVFDSFLFSNDKKFYYDKGNLFFIEVGSGDIVSSLRITDLFIVKNQSAKNVEDVLLSSIFDSVYSAEVFVRSVLEVIPNRDPEFLALVGVLADIGNDIFKFYSKNSKSSNKIKKYIEVLSCFAIALAHHDAGSDEDYDSLLDKDIADQKINNFYKYILSREMTYENVSGGLDSLIHIYGVVYDINESSRFRTLRDILQEIKQIDFRKTTLLRSIIASETIIARLRSLL